MWAAGEGKVVMEKTATSQFLSDVFGLGGRDEIERGLVLRMRRAGWEDELLVA